MKHKMFGWSDHARRYKGIYYCVQADRFSVQGMLGRSFATLEDAMAARDGENTHA